jgi:hypothetical protein
MRYVLVAKPDDHKILMEWVKGMRLLHEWINGVPLKRQQGCALG